MGNPERRKARQLLHAAREGVVKHGHQKIYGVIDKLRAAAARLDGRQRREVLFKCNEICQALDEKVEAFVTGVRDPSLDDRTAIYEGVYNLLSDCQPIYLALKSKGSLTEACDAFDEAKATLERIADEDEEYKKYRELNGGWVTIRGKRVKLDAKAFAKWQAEKKKGKRKFEEDPYGRTAQTTEAHIDAVFSEQKTNQRRDARQRARTKKARVEEDEPTPPGLEMTVRANNEKKYRVRSYLFKYAPEGYSNGDTTKEKAMQLLAECLANRPKGKSREEMHAARAQKGLPDGVHPLDRGYKARLVPKKKTVVTLAAPGGGFTFGTAAAAGKAIKKYEDAGSPTKPSHPLYDTLVYSVFHRK